MTNSTVWSARSAGAASTHSPGWTTTWPNTKARARAARAAKPSAARITAAANDTSISHSSEEKQTCNTSPCEQLNTRQPWCADAYASSPGNSSGKAQFHPGSRKPNSIFPWTILSIRCCACSTTTRSIRTFRAKAKRPLKTSCSKSCNKPPVLLRKGGHVLNHRRTLA